MSDSFVSGGILLSAVGLFLVGALVGAVQVWWRRRREQQRIAAVWQAHHRDPEQLYEQLHPGARECPVPLVHRCPVHGIER